MVKISMPSRFMLSQMFSALLRDIWPAFCDLGAPRPPAKAVLNWPSVIRMATLPTFLLSKLAGPAPSLASTIVERQLGESM